MLVFKTSAFDHSATSPLIMLNDIGLASANCACGSPANQYEIRFILRFLDLTSCVGHNRQISGPPGGPIHPSGEDMSRKFSRRDFVISSAAAGLAATTASSAGAQAPAGIRKPRRGPASSPGRAPAGRRGEGRRAAGGPQRGGRNGRNWRIRPGMT